MPVASHRRTKSRPPRHAWTASTGRAKYPRGLLPQGSGKGMTSPSSPPGSRGALLLPSPLRTARKPFGLCRSSLSQGPSRDPVGQTPHLHDTGPGLTSGIRRRPHQQQAAVICSASRASWSDGLVRRHPREVGPLSRGVISPRRLNPDPFDYRAAFASSLVLYPPSHRRPPCGGPTPRGGRRAYHVPRTDHGWCRLCLFADGSTATAGEERNPCTWPRTVLVQACQHLWLAGSHDVYRQFT